MRCGPMNPTADGGRGLSASERASASEGGCPDRAISPQCSNSGAEFSFAEPHSYLEVTIHVAMVQRGVCVPYLFVQSGRRLPTSTHHREGSCRDSIWAA
ncbi:hypothetical protein [Lysobacter gummosus]|uniref:hypothetical protein n=1 Tax=Lysobacter gummosus TaxID=262324 RepID=UPI0036360695